LDTKEENWRAQTNFEARKYIVEPKACSLGQKNQSVGTKRLYFGPKKPIFGTNQPIFEQRKTNSHQKIQF